MKTFFRILSRGLLALTAALGFSTAASAQGANALLTVANPRVQEVAAVQHAVTPELMSAPGILGTAIGLDGAGNVGLLVFVSNEAQNPGEIMRALPRAIRGVRVVPQVTDPFRALAGKPGGGSGHTTKQAPPIKLGTSGGWGSDLANGYCCGGTLGSLITIGGEQHILSNWHVLESDIVSGGNGIVATTGSAVIQPGLIDVSCRAENAQTVATLVVKNALPNSNVDAAIAKVVPGMVAPDGAILQIGTVSSSTAPAALNQLVKKSGRSSGLTRSYVAGLNATISVSYDNECAGGAAFTKTFTGQIVINNRLTKGKSFIIGGDSGSLLVEDEVTNPNPVGLLFAGSNFYAIANPIDEVLAFFGATMVGQ